jgi:hypothetical protein
MPERWAGTEDDGVITICDDNGVGALQASFVRTPGVVALDDIDNAARGFMKQLGLPAATSVEIGTVAGTQAVYFSGSVGDEHWRVWHFGRARRMCCLTYNCSFADKGVEEATVNEIVSHLELDY